MYRYSSTRRRFRPCLEILEARCLLAQVLFGGDAGIPSKQNSLAILHRAPLDEISTLFAPLIAREELLTTAANSSLDQTRETRRLDADATKFQPIEKRTLGVSLALASGSDDSEPALEEDQFMDSIFWATQAWSDDAS